MQNHKGGETKPFSSNKKDDILIDKTEESK